MEITGAALRVPPINMRQRIPEEAIQDVVEQIVHKFSLIKIILFGSYAYGSPRPESDVDLLVIMETSLRETQQAVQICQKIEYRFGVDLIVYTPASFAKRLELGDSFLNEIVSRGKVMYERPDA